MATSAKEQDLEAVMAAIGAPEGAVDCVVHRAEVARSHPTADILEAVLDRVGLRVRTRLPSGTRLGHPFANRCELSGVALLTRGIAAAELEAAGAAAVCKNP